MMELKNLIGKRNAIMLVTLVHKSWIFEVGFSRRDYHSLTALASGGKSFLTSHYAVRQWFFLQNKSFVGANPAWSPVKKGTQMLLQNNLGSPPQQYLQNPQLFPLLGVDNTYLSNFAANLT